jgi:uncharacterized protein (DUF2267 family)
MSMDEVERVGAVLGSPREGAAEDFFRAIQESGSLPLGIGVDEATSTVLCTLLSRLDLEPARQVLDALPPEVVDRVGRCPIHGGTVGESFAAEEFLRRVAQHLQIGEEVAAPVTAAVLHALRAQLPPHPNAAVERQLPRDLQNLWRGGART